MVGAIVPFLIYSHAGKGAGDDSNAFWASTTNDHDKKTALERTVSFKRRLTVLLRSQLVGHGCLERC